MVLGIRRPRTVLGCLVARRGPVRLPGLGAGWLPGASWGGGFPGCGSWLPGCFLVRAWAGRAASSGAARFPSRFSWPGGRARVARAPALPRGARSSRGDAPAAGRASARLPTARYRRGRRRSRDRPALAVICTSRPRNLAVGMPETVRRNPRPRFPREGRLPVRSRPSARAVGEVAGPRSRWPARRARRAVAMRVLTALRSRPSRVAAGSPARSSGTVNGTPRTFPSGATTATARCPALTSTASTGIRPQLAQRRGRAGSSGLPRRVEVPAPGRRVDRDVVADGPGGGLGGDLVAPVGELHRARQPVPAEGPVPQVGERGGEFDLQPALVRVVPDRFVSPRLAGLAVGGQEPAGGLPLLPPPGFGQARRRPGCGACAAGPARPASPRPARTPAAAPPGPAGPAAPAAGWSWRAARRGTRTRGPARPCRPPGRRPAPRSGGPGPGGWRAPRAGSGRRAATGPRWCG